MSLKIIVGIDPGLTGGLSILENNKEPLVYKIPVKKTIVNKKNKNIYDIMKIIDIFNKYKNKEILFVIEKQNVRRGEGAVSAMTIGKNYGLLLGIAYALGFNVIEVSPQKWKKHFPELINDVILEKREEIKELRIIGKKLKEKEEKDCNKKEIDKINRQIKKEAKKNARELVSLKYPNLADKFIKTNTDGMAESLLIAIFGKEKQNELVQI